MIPSSLVFSIYTSILARRVLMLSILCFRCVFFDLITLSKDVERPKKKSDIPDAVGMRKKGTANPEVRTIVAMVSEEVTTRDVIFCMLFASDSETYSLDISLHLQLAPLSFASLDYTCLHRTFFAFVCHPK